ncbi:GNAT family N-acetyltransferase [Undibacterium sp. TS12]|uniref:GNAT family N-acetyltransferase n=1 Tax=Undibacterium sp. TS12 TaxID=2908202 RepID=UPI001F4D2353|nr:GNAT family N-acetyltransferase [Undibacterium sp. TS12]MCH8621488.1 GNAT family N-acetyltransferase [Undibacterium sp. TS12]
MHDLTISLEAASPDQALQLADLRVLAMRPSLERIGRFDPERARQRLLQNFAAEYTRLIKLNGILAGFLVLRPQDNDLLLDHFYLHPDFQQRGLGSAVMQRVLAEADALGKIIHVGALRDSDANCFYLRHGFVLRETAEFDNYYLRYPQTTRENK